MFPAFGSRISLKMVSLALGDVTHVIKAENRIIQVSKAQRR